MGSATPNLQSMKVLENSQYYNPQSIIWKQSVIKQGVGYWVGGFPEVIIGWVLINSDSMLSPKGLKNEYFNIDEPNHHYSLLEEIHTQNDVHDQFSEIKWDRNIKQDRKEFFPHPSTLPRPGQQPKRTLNAQRLLFKEAESLHVPFLKLSRLEELSEIKEHSKSSRVKNERGVYLKNFKEMKNKVLDQYFVKEIEEKNRPEPVSAKLPMKIKRSLSEMKPSRMSNRKYESPNGKSKYKTKDLHLPTIRPNQSVVKRHFNKNKNSLGIQLSKLSGYKEPSIALSSRVESASKHKSYSVFKRSQSIKPLKVSSKLNFNKLKTQQSRTNQIQEQISVLNETLTQIRALNEIENKTNRLFTERLNYSSMLLDLQYQNLLKKRRNES